MKPVNHRPHYGIIFVIYEIQDKSGIPDLRRICIGEGPKPIFAAPLPTVKQKTQQYFASIPWGAFVSAGGEFFAFITLYDERICVNFW